MATFGILKISIIYKNRPLVCLVPAESRSTYSFRTVFMLFHVIHALLIVFIGWQSFPSFCNRQAVHSIAVISDGHKLHLCYQPKFHMEIWQFPVTVTTVYLGKPSTDPFVCVLVTEECHATQYSHRAILTNWTVSWRRTFCVAGRGMKVCYLACVMCLQM